MCYAMPLGFSLSLRSRRKENILFGLIRGKGVKGQCCLPPFLVKGISDLVADCSVIRVFTVISYQKSDREVLLSSDGRNRKLCFLEYFVTNYVPVCCNTLNTDILLGRVQNLEWVENSFPW